MTKPPYRPVHRTEPLDPKERAEIIVLHLIAAYRDLFAMAEVHDIRDHVATVMRRELPGVPEELVTNVRAMIPAPRTTPAPGKVGLS